MKRTANGSWKLGTREGKADKLWLSWIAGSSSTRDNCIVLSAFFQHWIKTQPSEVSVERPLSFPLIPCLLAAISTTFSAIGRWKGVPGRLLGLLQRERSTDVTVYGSGHEIPILYTFCFQARHLGRFTPELFIFPFPPLLSSSIRVPVFQPMSLLSWRKGLFRLCRLNRK